MSDGKAPAACSPTARTLHWITAALVLTAIPVGNVVPNLKVGPLQDSLCDSAPLDRRGNHPLIILRLGYRSRHPPSPRQMRLGALCVADRAADRRLGGWEGTL
jgi:hypothetical protein